MSSYFEYNFDPYSVVQIPVLTDNYIYMICTQTHAYVVDPALAEPVNEVLFEKNLQLAAILNTHQHMDHVGGNLELVDQWHCPVYASRYDEKRIPGITHKLVDGDTLELDPFRAEILFLPGHTLGHIAYFFKEQNWLFSGDTLFSLGCGRLFEGTAEQMHSSLSRLLELPDETLCFCTHEYTEANLDFSLSLLPEDPILLERQKNIHTTRTLGKPTVPMTLGTEKKSNLFLRWADPQLRKALLMESAHDRDVFAEVRKRKDHF